MTNHQKKIIEFARKNDNQITKKQACKLIPSYCNIEKHVGDILSRMVRKNILKRVKKSLYELSTGQIELINQTKIEFY